MFADRDCADRIIQILHIAAKHVCRRTRTDLLLAKRDRFFVAGDDRAREHVRAVESRGQSAFERVPFNCVRILRDKGIFSEYQARRNTSCSDVGRLAVYVFRAERVYGRVCAVDETGSGVVSDGVYADDAVIRGADDVFGEYAVGAWNNACGKRSTENRATVRAGQFREIQYDECGTRNDHGDQFKPRHSKERKVIMKRKRLVVFAAVNVLLLFAAIFCMAKTCENNRRINGVCREFRYAEESGGQVTLELTSGRTVKMCFGKNAVCVYDCYLYDNSDAAEILLFVRRYGQENGVSFARKNTELLGEFTLHKAAYKAGVRREESENLDWDYGKDSRPIVNALSKAIGHAGL